MNFFEKNPSVTDSQLESSSQMQIASLVKGLPSEDLSMSWRSQLNEKLVAAEKAKSKKRMARRMYAWGSTLSLGAAAGVFGIVIMNAPAVKTMPQSNERSAFASELVRTHQESLVLASVSGTGSAARETSFEEEPYGFQDELL